MDNFLNNGQKFEINCRSSYITYINIYLEKKCWFENWIFKFFFLEIYRRNGLYPRVRNKGNNKITENEFTVKSYYCGKKKSFLGYK